MKKNDVFNENDVFNDVFKENENLFKKTFQILFLKNDYSWLQDPQWVMQGLLLDLLRASGLLDLEVKELGQAPPSSPT